MMLSMCFSLTCYKSWINSPTDEPRRKEANICSISDNRYRQIFHQFIKQSLQTYSLQKFDQVYLELTGESFKKLRKRLKGRCFGISMALAAFHLQYPHATFKDALAQDGLLEQACYYSLLDLIRVRVNELNINDTFLEIEETAYHLKKVYVFNLGAEIKNDSGVNILQRIKSILSQLSYHVTLVRIYSTVKKVSSALRFKPRVCHSIFFYQNSRDSCFYFYDTKFNKQPVTSLKEEEIHHLFLSHIQRHYQSVLNSSMTWLFSSRVLMENEGSTLVEAI